MSRSRLRKFRSLEKNFLKFYSAWQETHRFEFANQSFQLLGELLHLNPGYSFRYAFERAF